MTLDDVAAGKIVNTASAKSDLTGEVTDSETTPVSRRPELTLDKSIIGEPVVLGDGSQIVTYEFEVTNTGDIIIEDVQLTDDLGDVFGDLNVTVNSNVLTTEPASFGGDENTAYDGVFDINLLDGLGSLNVDEVLIVQLEARITPDVATSYINKATASGYNALAGTVVKPSESTASIDLIPAAKANDLIIRKTANPRTVQIGDPVLYTIDVTNSGIGNISNIDIVDNIPAGFAYIPNSASLSDGASTVDVEPIVAGRSSLSWSLGTGNAPPLDTLAPLSLIHI